MEKVIGIYRITYPKYNTSQVKNLISHEDYENIYKKESERIQEFETEIAGLNKKKHQDKIRELNQEIKDIKKKLSNYFGSEFFTDKSPIWISRYNGGIMMLPWQQGGLINVELEKL